MQSNLQNCTALQHTVVNSRANSVDFCPAQVICLKLVAQIQPVREQPLRFTSSEHLLFLFGQHHKSLLLRRVFHSYKKWTLLKMFPVFIRRYSTPSGRETESVISDSKPRPPAILLVALNPRPVSFKLLLTLYRSYVVSSAAKRKFVSILKDRFESS